VFHSLKPFLYGACVLCLSIQGAQAAGWREHKFAGFSAFDNGDLTSAVEHFEAALTIAYEKQVAAQDIGPILENLATAYFAVGRHKDARDSIKRWDKTLAQSANGPWVSQQQNFRDQLAHFIIETLGKTEAKAELPTKSAFAAAATKATLTSGDFAIHLVSLGVENNVDSSWHQLNAAYPSQLTGRSLVVKQVDLGDQGTFHRILAAPFADSAGAEKACSELEGLGQYCVVLPLE
jgi:tetratricopeptide (TPR) repeat protein